MMDRCERGWIQTFTGRRFWPLNPRPGDVHLEDIAHSLSLTCRFRGHCSRFYSVAEHCVFASRFAECDPLAALLHDAAEAYLADFPAPVKPLVEGFGAAEDRIMELVAAVYSFEWPMSEEVETIDRRMLATERNQLHPLAEEWPSVVGVKPFGVVLPCWSPSQAEREFRERFLELV